MFSVQNFKRHFVSEYPITKNRKDLKWSLCEDEEKKNKANWLIGRVIIRHWRSEGTIQKQEVIIIKGKEPAEPDRRQNGEKFNFMLFGIRHLVIGFANIF